MSFQIASAILRGRWLIDKNWVQSNLPLIFRAAQGTSFEDEKRDESPDAMKIQCAYAGVYSVNPYTDLSKIPDGAIAVVNVKGPIMKYGGMCSWGSADKAALVSRLANTSNIKGIIADIDSPGGQADGTAMLADSFLDARKKKPVWSIIDDGMAASAAMWVASATEKIFVTKKTDQVGSVGVYTTIADWNKYYMDFHKLPVKDIYAPQSTDKNKDYMDALAGDEEGIKEDLKVLAQEFIDTVKRNRGDRATKNESKWNTGKMFYANDAMKIGLIDGIKSFNDVVRSMNQLINQKEATTNKNTMAFNKTLKAAKADKFEVVDEGFVLTEENLNNVEAHITAQENTITSLEQKEKDANTAKTKAEGERDAATAKVTAKEKEIETLTARVAELEEETPITTTTKKADDGGKRKVKAHENPNSSINQLADKFFGAPGAKKIVEEDEQDDD